MFENRFDQALDNASRIHDINWDDDSKVRVFARFLQESKANFADFLLFVENQAIEENDTSFADVNDELINDHRLD